MRHRICMAIITANNSGSIVRREDKAQLEKNQRRAQFEKDYKKNKRVFSGIEKNSELVNFSNNLAREIEMFKQSRRN